MLELVERHTTGKARLLRLLDDIAVSDWRARTIYLTPASLAQRIDSRSIHPPRVGTDEVSIIINAIEGSDTGVAVFIGHGRAIAICPPFPLDADAHHDGAVASPLLRLLDTEYTIGIILLRLGRYAVGVLRGDRLLASKTATRYMKNRHRAGGQSQRRFQRSRERLIRELYDKTCQTARDVFTPHADGMDYILLGGESSTLNGFIDRCPRIRALADKTLDRRLAIDLPNQKTLNNIAFEAWKSRVYSFQSIPEPG